MVTLFYIFGVLCLYSYFLYPLILKLLPAREFLHTDGKSDAKTELPVLSLIITVHNEEARIREKLDNTLKINYPSDLLEIIVASDFSADETDNIVESYVEKGVRLVRADERKGKEYAQLCAIRASKGEILVFSDVATQIPVDALRLLAARFADPQVGALSSEDQFISNDGSVVGEGAYPTLFFTSFRLGINSTHRPTVLLFDNEVSVCIPINFLGVIVTILGSFILVI